MIRFIVKTVARLLLLMFCVSFVCFLLVQNSPIDITEAYAPAESNISEEQRETILNYWGVNDPPVQRYLKWLRNFVRGDLGESFLFKKPVAQVIRERFLTSLALMLTAWVFSGLLGFLLGFISGAREGSLFDRIVKTFCFVLSSTPTFWIGLLLLMTFAVRLQWFPMGFAVPVGKAAAEVTLTERIHHLILPAFTLSITGVASITLHTRQKMLDVMKSDYVLFAKARGETLIQIIRRHGLRNIAIPAVTLQFSSFSELFGGSVLAEQVFSYPGMGNAATAAGLSGDIPTLMGVTMFSVIFVFTGNLIANLLYGVLDPRISAGKGRV